MGLFISRESGPECNNCSICLEKIKNDILVLECGHQFHFHCVSTWIEREGTCPNCRSVAIIQKNLCNIIKLKSRELCGN